MLPISGARDERGAAVFVPSLLTLTGFMCPHPAAIYFKALSRPDYQLFPLNEGWRVEPGDRAQRTHLPPDRVRSELIHLEPGKNNPPTH